MVYHKETKNKQDVCCLYVKSSNEGNIVFTMISFKFNSYIPRCYGRIESFRSRKARMTTTKGKKNFEIQSMC